MQNLEINDHDLRELAKQKEANLLTAEVITWVFGLAALLFFVTAHAVIGALFLAVAVAVFIPYIMSRTDHQGYLNEVQRHRFINN